MASYEKLDFTNTCQLAFSVRNSPVFAMAAVNPYAYQLYGPEATQPIHVGYKRFTVAGVLIGYNHEAADPYWEMLVRRQGVGNNHVRVLLETEYPFAGMGYMAYQLVADTDDFKVNNAEGVVSEVCSLQELNSVPTDVTTLRVLPKCMNDDAMLLQINHLPELRVLEIGDYSMQHVIAFSLHGLPNLRSVSIGTGCFSHFDGQGLPEASTDRRVLSITSNPQLEVITIGSLSFSEFEELELKGRRAGEHSRQIFLF